MTNAEIRRKTLKEFLASQYAIQRINGNTDPQLLIDEWHWARDPNNPYNQGREETREWYESWHYNSDIEENPDGQEERYYYYAIPEEEYARQF